jgi:Domain of unknown function (DUF4388)
VSKLVELGERARESRDETGGAELTSGSPPLPGKQAPATTVGTGPVEHAFTAPTIGPPEAPQSEPWLASSTPVSAAPSEAEGGHRGAGFTSVIRHLSLRGWLRWVHSNRSDATLRIRTWEGGSGRIWCSGGKIIDAEWDGRVTEEALRDMLLLSSGAVTIDFDPVEHPCRIVSPTHELLHLAEGGSDGTTDARHPEAALAASPIESVRDERSNRWPLLPAASLPPAARSTSLRPRPDPRRLSRGAYLVGALVLAALAVAGFAFGRLRASSELAASNARAQPLTQQTRTGLYLAPAPAKAESEVPIIRPKPRDLSLIPFVPIEVEPAHAEIWLDRELAGRGGLRLGAIHDGMMHELRFVAPQHETKTLFFRDMPPAGRVILKRIAENENGAAPAEVDGAPDEASRDPAEAASAGNDSGKLRAKHDASKKVTRRRAGLPAPAPARERPAAEDVPSAEKPAPRRSPQVELIEVHTPRVQVLD